MLKIVTGKDLKKVLKQANKIATDFLSSNSNGTIEKHTTETLSFKDLEYRSTGNSLFNNLTVYILDAFIDADQDSFIKLAGTLGGSKNLFIFCEESIIKDIEKACTSTGGEVAKLLADEKVKDNPFAITDALIARDKKKTWLLYRQEIDRGESAEAILGRFVWAIKTLTLIQKNPKDTAVTLGISPFVYSKTKTGLKNWKEGETESFYTELLFGLKQGEEMETHLEKLILGVL